MSIGITHCPLLSICRVRDGSSKTTLAREKPGFKRSRISGFTTIRFACAASRPSFMNRGSLSSTLFQLREALYREILAQGLLQLVLDEPVCLADKDNDRHCQHDRNGSANDQ